MTPDQTRELLERAGEWPKTRTETGPLVRALASALREALSGRRIEAVAYCRHCGWNGGASEDREYIFELANEHAASCEKHPLRIRAEQAEAKLREAPHMCRDEHPMVRWAGDSEMCPVCVESSKLREAEGRIETLTDRARLAEDMMNIAMRDHVAAQAKIALWKERTRLCSATVERQDDEIARLTAGTAPERPNHSERLSPVETAPEAEG